MNSWLSGGEGRDFGGRREASTARARGNTLAEESVDENEIGALAKQPTRRGSVQRELNESGRRRFRMQSYGVPDARGERASGVFRVTGLSWKCLCGQSTKRSTKWDLARVSESVQRREGVAKMGQEEPRERVAQSSMHCIGSLGLDATLGGGGAYAGATLSRPYASDRQSDWLSLTTTNAPKISRNFIYGGLSF